MKLSPNVKLELEAFAEFIQGKKESNEVCCLLKTLLDENHSPEDAADAISDLVASEVESPAKNYLLGYCYRHALGVEINDERTVELFQEAAAVNYAPALYALGDYHRNVLYDRKYGRELIQKSALQGYSFAQYNLAGFYKLGLSGVTNYRCAAELYQLAAKQGCKASQRVLKEFLSEVFSEPLQVESFTSIEDVTEFCNFALENNIVLAHFRLAELLNTKKEGIPYNPTAALESYQKFLKCDKTKNNDEENKTQKEVAQLKVAELSATVLAETLQNVHEFFTTRNESCSAEQTHRIFTPQLQTLLCSYVIGGLDATHIEDAVDSEASVATGKPTGNSVPGLAKR